MEPLIVAHRGANRLAPENTAEAFVKAIELGADGVELDVRQTLDGVLVVFHDAEINGRVVKDLTFQELSKAAQELRGINIPTLEEVLAQVKNYIPVFIEIKDRGYEPQTAQTVLKILPPQTFYIISFNFDSLKFIKEKFPNIRTGLTLGMNIKNLLGAAIFKNYYLQFVDLFLFHIILWKLGCAKVLPKNIPLAVWTTNQPTLIKRLLLEPSIYALLTDDSGLAIKLKSNK